MSLSPFVLITSFLFGSILACHPQFEKELRYLDHYLGLRPVDDGEPPSKEASQFTSYVTRQDQLDCNLSDECYWRNAATDGLLDTSEWWLFEKADAGKTFPYQIAPGANRLAHGTRLLLAGNTSNTAESAVLITAPIACQRGIGNLTFNYWLYNQAKIEVIITKAMNRRRHIQTLLRPPINCHYYRPAQDKCRIVIPEINEPFRIAIRAFNLKDTVVGSMAMINNITYKGDLCGDSPFPTYFSSVGLPPPSPRPIKSLSEMECSRPRHKCGWSNAESSQSEWRVARSADMWQKIFQNPTPSPKAAFIFLAVDGLSPRPFATLRSAMIPCTQTTTTLSMRYWLKTGTQVEVCAVDDDGIPLSCVYLTEEDSGNVINIDVDAFSKPFRFTIEMINFDSTGMGFVAVADLKLTGLLCSEQPPPIVTTIDPPTIVSLFGLQRGPGAQAPYSLELGCDFTQDYCSQWVNDDGNVAYGVTPRDTRKFPIPVEIKGNVAVFMLHSNQTSELRSRQVPCAAQDATLSVSYFRSQHSHFRLCALGNCIEGAKTAGEISIPISSPTPFEVRLEASANSPGVVIIKQIRTEGEVCALRTVEQLVCHKLQCSFQDDLCQYQTVVERPEDAVLTPGSKGLSVTLTTEKKRAMLRSDDFDLPSSSLLVISITQTTFGSRVLICPDVTSLAELCHEVLGPRVVSAEPRRIAFPLDAKARRFALVLEHDHAEQFGSALFEVHAIDIRSESDNQLCF